MGPLMSLCSAVASSLTLGMKIAYSRQGRVHPPSPKPEAQMQQQKGINREWHERDRFVKTPSKEQVKRETLGILRDDDDRCLERLILSSCCMVQRTIDPCASLTHVRFASLTRVHGLRFPVVWPPFPTLGC